MMKRVLLAGWLWAGVAFAADVPPDPAPAVPAPAAPSAPAPAAAPVPAPDPKSDPDRAAEWRSDLAADALRPKLAERAAAHDATGLLPLLAQVPPLRPAEGYPGLIHAAIDAIDTVTSDSADPDGTAAKKALLAEKEAALAELTKNTVTLREFLNHPFPAYEGGRPANPAPAGMVYVDGPERAYLVPEGNTGGDQSGGVYAGHYPGFAPYYPDPHGLYPVLSEAELAQAQGCLAEIQRDSTRVGQIDNAVSATDANRMKDRVALAGKRAGLLAEPAAADEQVLARLRDAAALAPVDAEPVIAQALRDWPGSEAVQRFALDAAERALDQGDAQAPVARQLLVHVTLPSPRMERVRKRIADAVRSQAPVLPPVEALASLTAPVSAAQQEASNRKLADALAALRAGQFQATVAAFREARDLWPDNPEAASRLRTAEIAGGVAVVLGLIVLLYLYTVFASWADRLRFRRAMKEQAKRKY